MTYWLYTWLTLPRLRCHIPSLAWEHVGYEATAYFFIFASGVLILRFGAVALRESDHYWENGIALALAFSFNVFAFALVYYVYGMEAPSVYFTSLPWETSGVAGTIVQENGAWTELPVEVFEQRREMVRSPWNYLAFSLSNAVPGGNAFNYEICKSASVFVLLQSILGIGFTLMLTLFGAKVSRIFS